MIRARVLAGYLDYYIAAARVTTAAPFTVLLLPKHLPAFKEATPS